MKKKTLYISICLLLGYFQLFSQNETDTLWTEQLSEVEISASRLDGTDSQVPAALSIVGSTQIQTAQPQLSLNESLPFVPGLLALNPDNFAQDLRVSIRGFGARAAFGIRGIKIMVDGLPETTPDGQSQVDNLALGVLQQMEIIRGPASGLYGNASGGVINVKTENPPEDFFAETRLMAGSYGLQQYQLKAGQQLGAFSYLLHGSHTLLDGYRENSAVQNTLLNGKLNFELHEDHRLSLILNHVDSPQADDPGGINRAAVEEDRRQARDANLRFQGGEEVVQSKVGLTYEGSFSPQHSLNARLFYINRDFNNRLPFGFGGIVNLQRAFYGGGFTYQFEPRSTTLDYRLRAGLDWESQSDDRLRFVNLDGERGALTFDQQENFQNVGLYLLQDLGWNNWTFKLGLRLDAARLEALDRFLSDGDDSGKIEFNNFNPMVGASYRISDALNLYGSYSSSFETPALSELSNNPDGGGGFNDQLKPQKAQNYEIGLKGTGGSALKYSLALFYLDITNELIPFELEDFPGRTFYRNAGNSSRRGLELEGNWLIASGLIAQFTYTYSNFQYEDYETDSGNLEGNITPGIPKHTAATGVSYLSPGGFFAALQARFVGEMYLNDSNSETDDAYALVNLRVRQSFEFSNWTLEPFFGLNNLFNAFYNSNIRINAFGGRFFEPGAERNVYLGVRARFGN
jgi:iron complex outermembrane receptor protein